MDENMPKIISGAPSDLSLGEVILIERKRRGLSRREVAELAGCSQQLVMYVENYNPTATHVALGRIMHIADVLGLELTISIRRKDTQDTTP